MTERGRAGRAVAVAIGALLLAALVVRNAVVEFYAGQDPARAARIWPGHPAVILASGFAEVGAAAAAARPVNPAVTRRMQRASAKAPMAPEPFLVRGVEAQVAGDESGALQAFLAARARDPRSVAARYFLAEHYLKARATQQGLAEISALTRLVPQSLSQMAPQLAAFARMPGGRQQVGQLLRRQPQLEPSLLYELAASPADSKLALSLWSGRTGNQDLSWQQRMLNGLVAAGRFQEARAAWARFDPGADVAADLVDPKFEGRAMPPFGWTLASGPAGVAEAAGNGSLHLLFYGRDDVALASQTLMLKPGTYRLAMRVNGAQPSTKSLLWTVRCTSPAHEISAVSLDKARGGVFVLDFTIPAEGCAAQQLDLAGRAPELPEQVDLSISQLRLSRIGS